MVPDDGPAGIETPGRPFVRLEGLQPMARIKRGYSRDFTPHAETGKRYLLDAIPAGLWSAVRARCKREGISVRALILQLLTAWIEAQATTDERV